MPEPDFDQIARTVLDTPSTDRLYARVAEQLRLIWNARGAADREIVDADGDVGLDRAIRTLDR